MLSLSRRPCVCSSCPEGAVKGLHSRSPLERGITTTGCFVFCFFFLFFSLSLSFLILTANIWSTCRLVWWRGRPTMTRRGLLTLGVSRVPCGWAMPKGCLIASESRPGEKKPRSLLSRVLRPLYFSPRLTVTNFSPNYFSLSPKFHSF